MRIGLVIAGVIACSGDRSASNPPAARSEKPAPPVKPAPPPAQVVSVPDLELRLAVPANPQFDKVRDNVATVTTSACTVTLHAFERASYASKAEPAWDDGYAAAKVAPASAHYTTDTRTGRGRTWTVEWTGSAGWGIRQRVALADGRVVDCAGDCATDTCAACVEHACETIE